MKHLIALIFGVAASFWLICARGWLLAKFHRDIEWMRVTSLRFNPHPINARQRTIIMYGVFGLVLAGLWVVAPNPIVAILFWLVLMWVPKIAVEVAWKRRRKAIDEQLPTTIAAMCNSIRAGLTLVQAIQRLADQAPEPIRTEFQIMANRYAFGADLATTIKEAKERLDLQNFNLFASALLLNREMGGDVAETLNRISQSLDRLKQMKLTVEASTSEGRTNIKVLLVAPIIMLLMLSTIDPKGVNMLFTTPEGYGVLLLAAALTGTGVYFALRITRSEV